MNDAAKLPRDDTAEKFYLGCFFQYPDRAAELFALGVSDSDFFDSYHQQIHKALREQQQRGGINIELLRKRLKPETSTSGDLSRDYFDDLASLVPSTIHADDEANKIIEASRKRRLYPILEHYGKQLLNGVAVHTTVRGLTADLDDFNRELQSKEPQFPLISALELATAKYVLNYLIERVLVEKQPCILGGPKKSLKTTLAIVFAIHIALGIDLFAKFRIDRLRRVLVASAESGMGTIQETAQRICEALGVKLADIQNLTFTANVPKPNDATSLAEFRAALEESGAEVLILDPFYRMFDGEGQESIFKMGLVLGRIDDLCQELGVTLVLCHHLKTGRFNQYAPAELDDLAYAGCAEFFRQWLLISRREAYEPGSGKHALWLTIGGSAGHNSLWALDIDEGHYDDAGGRRWDATLLRADDARNAAQKTRADAKATEAEQKFADDSTAICRLLAKYPNGTTKTNLRNTLRNLGQISDRRFPFVFDALCDDGAIVDCEVKVGNKKTPQPGFKLRDSDI